MKKPQKNVTGPPQWKSLVVPKLPAASAVPRE